MRKSWRAVRPLVVWHQRTCTHIHAGTLETCIHIYIYIHAYTGTHARAHTRSYMCTHTCGHDTIQHLSFLHTYLYLCSKQAHAVNRNKYRLTHVHARAHTCTHKHTHTHTHTHICFAHYIEHTLPSPNCAVKEMSPVREHEEQEQADLDISLDELASCKRKHDSGPMTRLPGGKCSVSSTPCLLFHVCSPE
jgi:hypothetical protein